MVAESLEPPNELLHTKLHQLLSSVEQLQQAGQYRGDLARLLDLVDSAGHDRPVRRILYFYQAIFRVP